MMMIQLIRTAENDSTRLQVPNLANNLSLFGVTWTVN